MNCKKYTLTNTGETSVNFTYRRCDDTMWQYQVPLEPGQTKNIFSVEDSFSSAFSNSILLTDEGKFPPDSNLILITFSSGYFPGSIGATYLIDAGVVLDFDLTVTFVDTIDTKIGRAHV